MEHFVTCFDSYFLPQGLALYDSIGKHVPDATLWVVCLNVKAYAYLKERKDPGLKPLLLDNLEDEKLLSVKPHRSRAEYIYTLSPFLPKWVFEQDESIERVTYLDADTYFFDSPAAIFTEFEASGKDVLITDHAYDKEHDQSALLGRYCVQFITYKRKGSEPVRKWWESRCIEWCYARWEDGKYGDQKYLDEWPKLFGDRVHVLQQLNSILAPWNVSRYQSPGFVMWHFHGFRLLNDYKVLLHSTYRIPEVVDNEVYMPYVEAVKKHISAETYSPVSSVKLNLLRKRLRFIAAAVARTVIRRKLYSIKPRIQVRHL
jgi:hypothetical protein